MDEVFNYEICVNKFVLVSICLQHLLKLFRKCKIITIIKICKFIVPFSAFYYDNFVQIALSYIILLLFYFCISISVSSFSEERRHYVRHSCIFNSKLT